jgi:hypothetical protein
MHTILYAHHFICAPFCYARIYSPQCISQHLRLFSLYNHTRTRAFPSTGVLYNNTDYIYYIYMSSVQVRLFFSHTRGKAFYSILYF